MTVGPSTILFLHPSAELYGADRTLLQLVRGLDPLRWRAVVALPRRGPLTEALEQAGATIEVGELGVGTRGDLTPRRLLSLALRSPRAARFVRRLVRRHAPSVVHTNTMVVLGGAVGARCSRVRHLWHVHEILDRPRWLAGLYARILAWLADEVISNSEATREAFNRFYPPLALKHRVVFNGVDSGRLDPERADPAAVRAELDLDAQAPLVLLVGRLNPRKGHLILVEAAAQLRQRHPNARYLLVGDPPDGQEHLETELDAAIERAGLADRVLRRPFHRDVASLYAAACVCVVPSTAPESFCLVAAEAMALGRPVVASNLGGVAEVVAPAETGLLVPPGDSQALAEALDELLSDPGKAARMGAAGRRRQEDLFSVGRYVREFEQIYGPRRIVHLVLGKANPDRANGVNRVVHHLAAAQTQAGREVEVWGLTTTPNAPAGERPYPLRCFQRRTLGLLLDPELRRAISALTEPTLFHLHGGLLPDMTAAARRIVRAGHSYVFTPHGAYQRQALRRRPRLKRLMIALFDRRLCAGARALQVFSRAEAEDVALVAPRAPIAVVANGQDPLVIARPAELELPQPVFGFLGRLTAHTKGLDVLLAAFARYAESSPGTLVLVGEGPDRPALEAQARTLGLSDRVVFLGARYGEEKLALVAAFDAFVHPSRHEGLPGAVLEAAALGLPLIITAGTNLTEDVFESGAGMALADTDLDSLTDALERFSSADAATRRAWSEGASKMIEDRFTWRRIEEQLATELYGVEPIEPAPPGTVSPAIASDPAPALPANQHASLQQAGETRP